MYRARRKVGLSHHPCYKYQEPLDGKSHFTRKKEHSHFKWEIHPQKPTLHADFFVKNICLKIKRNQWDSSLHFLKTTKKSASQICCSLESATLWAHNGKMFPSWQVIQAKKYFLQENVTDQSRWPTHSSCWCKTKFKSSYQVGP